MYRNSVQLADRPHHPPTPRVAPRLAAVAPAREKVRVSARRNGRDALRCPELVSSARPSPRRNGRRSVGPPNEALRPTRPLTVYYCSFSPSSPAGRPNAALGGLGSRACPGRRPPTGGCTFTAPKCQASRRHLFPARRRRAIARVARAQQFASRPPYRLRSAPPSLRRSPSLTPVRFAPGASPTHPPAPAAPLPPRRLHGSRPSARSSRRHEPSAVTPDAWRRSAAASRPPPPIRLDPAADRRSWGSVATADGATCSDLWGWECPRPPRRAPGPASFFSRFPVEFHGDGG
jgi:hypothetical protein